MFELFIQHRMSILYWDGCCGVTSANDVYRQWYKTACIYFPFRSPRRLANALRFRHLCRRVEHDILFDAPWYHIELLLGRPTPECGSFCVLMAQFGLTSGSDFSDCAMGQTFEITFCLFCSRFVSACRTYWWIVFSRMRSFFACVVCGICDALWCTCRASVSFMPDLALVCCIWNNYNFVS